MRTRVFIGALMGLCAWAGSLNAQTPARVHSLSLYATVGASGGGTKNKSNVRIDPGGFALGGNMVSAEERHYTQQRESEDMINLNVEIRNLAKLPDSAKLEWFFYGRNLKGGEPFLFDSGSKDVSVGAVGTSKVELQSKALVSKLERKAMVTDGVDASGLNASSGSVTRSGQKVVGWIVRISDGPKVLAVRASSPSFETMERSLDLQKAAPAKKRK